MSKHKFKVGDYVRYTGFVCGFKNAIYKITEIDGDFLGLGDWMTNAMYFIPWEPRIGDWITKEGITKYLIPADFFMDMNGWLPRLNCEPKVVVGIDPIQSAAAGASERKQEGKSHEIRSTPAPQFKVGDWVIPHKFDCVANGLVKFNSEMKPCIGKKYKIKHLTSYNNCNCAQLENCGRGEYMLGYMWWTWPLSALESCEAPKHESAFERYERELSAAAGASERKASALEGERSTSPSPAPQFNVGDILRCKGVGGAKVTVIEICNDFIVVDGTTAGRSEWNIEETIRAGWYVFNPAQIADNQRGELSKKMEQRTVDKDAAFWSEHQRRWMANNCPVKAEKPHMPQVTEACINKVATTESDAKVEQCRQTLKWEIQKSEAEIYQQQQLIVHYRAELKRLGE